MNPASTTFLLGYHGCDAAVAEKVFAGKTSLTASENDYDWLGHGIYFWEHNAQRAYEFAREVRARSGRGNAKLRRPAVVGAIVDLAFCLNLLDSRYIEMVEQAYGELVALHRDANEPLPSNAAGPDLVLRRLDCAVVEMLHTMRDAEGQPPFDTVRAAFTEGGRLYPNAGFYAKSHIQICVRNAACVKGYFRPLGEDGKPLSFG